jgi:hypothetical protein
MTGFLLAFWATPTMTAGHFLFATATSGYIHIALQLEERDLVGYHGDQYRAYRKQVGMLFPRRRALKSSTDSPSSECEQKVRSAMQNLGDEEDLAPARPAVPRFRPVGCSHGASSGHAEEVPGPDLTASVRRTRG